MTVRCIYEAVSCSNCGTVFFAVFVQGRCVDIGDRGLPVCDTCALGRDGYDSETRRAA